MASLLFMRFPDGRAKTVTFSYDDGVKQDKRFMEIMDKHGLKATFNINAGLFKKDEGVQGTDRMTVEKSVEAYANSGHEVAIHALTHPFLEQLPTPRATYEIIEDRRRLEELFGHTIRGMAYPFGTTNDNVVEILKNAGIVYARTVVKTGKFDIPTDWLRLPATAKHTDPNLMDLAEQFLNDPKIGARAPQMFYLWGHTHEFDKDDNWDVIEKFAETIGGKEDIWYATNIEIFDYITAYKQLRFTVNMDLVENPTATDLYFSWEGKDYVVKAGESLKLDR